VWVILADAASEHCTIRHHLTNQTDSQNAGALRVVEQDVQRRRPIGGL
jgi:hypothetical protein